MVAERQGLYRPDLQLVEASSKKSVDVFSPQLWAHYEVSFFLSRKPQMTTTEYDVWKEGVIVNHKEKGILLSWKENGEPHRVSMQKEQERIHIVGFNEDEQSKNGWKIQREAWIRSSSCEKGKLLLINTLRAFHGDSIRDVWRQNNSGIDLNHTKRK